jgi:hypothetical protein
MKWERGDISFLFEGHSKPSQSLTVIDNKLKVYQSVRYEESEAEVEDEVDILMSSDIVAAQMSTKSITFTRAQSGWLWREDKTVRSEAFFYFSFLCFLISFPFAIFRKHPFLYLLYTFFRTNFISK